MKCLIWASALVCLLYISTASTEAKEISDTENSLTSGNGEPAIMDNVLLSRGVRSPKQGAKDDSKGKKRRGGGRKKKQLEKKKKKAARKERRQKKKKKGKSRGANKKKGKRRKRKGNQKKKSKQRKRGRKNETSKGKRKARRKNKAKKKNSNLKKNRRNKKKQKSRNRRKLKEKMKTARQAATCLQNVASLAGYYGIQVRTLDRLVSRAESFGKVMKGKKNKKEVFKDNLSLLESSVGGSDVKAGKCNGAGLNTNETSTLETLQQCQAKVDERCADYLNETLLAKVTECKAVVETFRTEMDPIVKKGTSDTDICTKANSIASGKVLTDVTNCISILNPEVTELVTRKNNCTASFGACRAAERETISHIYKCKPGCSVPGVTTETEAKKELEMLNKLDGELEASENKINDAMDKAGVKTGPGSDGTVPNSALFLRLRDKLNRERRQTGDGCNSVLTELRNFNKSASAAGSDPNGAFDQTSAGNANTNMKNIASRATLADDLKACNTTSPANKQITIVFRIAIIEVRFLLFWGNRWRVLVIRIRIVFIQITFGITTTAAPTTTTATTVTTSTTPTTSSVTATPVTVTTPSPTPTQTPIIVTTASPTPTQTPVVVTTGSRVLVGKRKVRMIGSAMKFFL